MREMCNKMTHENKFLTKNDVKMKWNVMFCHKRSENKKDKKVHSKVSYFFFTVQGVSLLSDWFRLMRREFETENMGLRLINQKNKWINKWLIVTFVAGTNAGKCNDAECWRMKHWHALLETVHKDVFAFHYTTFHYSSLTFKGVMTWIF